MESNTLVMEDLEEETLAWRPLRGALPPNRALQHGIEVSDALDKVTPAMQILPPDIQKVYFNANSTCRLLVAVLVMAAPPGTSTEICDPPPGKPKFG